MGRWVLALAVLGTAPLAMWGGGCSSSLNNVQPDASAGAGGGSGAGGGEAGTSGGAGTGGFHEGAGAGGHSGAGGGGGACPECCPQTGDSPHCSSDGHEYFSCALVRIETLPSGCACPRDGIYSYVWQAQTCGALGCVNPGSGGFGPEGCVGGASGGGGT
jgi:hypothetical protein